MIKIILAYMLIQLSLNATGDIAKNNTCKGCHPIIYAEYTKSAHLKSSIFKDSIHKAVWDKHPAKAKNKYVCNECHTPTDKRITKALLDNTNAAPVEDKVQTKEAISCIYCHSIKSIQKHTKKHNKNILVNNVKKRPTLFAASTEKKGTKLKYKVETSFMGMFKSTTGSPYHDIDYSNENYYTGNMCMGCHAHFENKHDISICKIEENAAKSEKQNCITCHMPQVKGSATTIAISKKHTFHGFAGTRNKPEMMAKYLKISFIKTPSGFDLTLKNEATHKLFIHTFRKAQLNVRVNRGTTTKTLKSTSFVRTVGTNNNHDFPWLANEILEDTMLKAGESRTIKYATEVNSGDMIEAEFGFYLVNPEMDKALNLINIKEATEFKILKTDFFQVK